MNAHHNNQVTVVGIVASGFTFSHEYEDEKFFAFTLEVQRMSGTKDYLPIIISEVLIDTKQIYLGKPVLIVGQFRSYNKKDETGRHLMLNIFVQDCYIVDEVQVIDRACITGFVCKPPVYRVTPLGRRIADVMLAVPRPYGKTDYIPCVAWGRYAIFASGLNVGTMIQVEGRIQSREYQKKDEAKTAFELSISKIEGTNYEG